MSILASSRRKFVLLVITIRDFIKLSVRSISLVQNQKLKTKYEKHILKNLKIFIYLGLCFPDLVETKSRTG